MAQKLKFLPEIKYSPRVNKKVSQIVGNELTNLSKPCYYPKMVRYFKDLKADLGITDDDIARFKKENLSRKYASFVMMKDNQIVCLMMTFIFFAQAKKITISKLFFLYLNLVFQSNLMHRQFPKFCNPDAYALAFDRVSHRHLYKQKGGIPPTVQFISEAEFKKWHKLITGPRLTDESFVKMVYASRTRLNQSIKSFAEIYYKIAKDKSSQISGDDAESKLEGVADRIAMMMCIYGNIDKSALSNAILKSGIRKDVGIMIISELSTPDYKEQLRFIILLMHKLSGLNNICIEAKRLGLLRKIVSGQKINNYAIRDEMLKLLKTLPSSYTLNSLHNDQLIMFLSHYITLYLKGRIC